MGDDAADGVELTGLEHAKAGGGLVVQLDLEGIVEAELRAECDLKKLRLNRDRAGRAARPIDYTRDQTGDAHAARRTLQTGYAALNLKCQTLRIHLCLHLMVFGRHCGRRVSVNTRGAVNTRKGCSLKSPHAHV